MEAVEASLVFTWDAEIFQVPLERNEDQPSSQLGREKQHRWGCHGRWLPGEAKIEMGFRIRMSLFQRAKGQNREIKASW